MYLSRYGYYYLLEQLWSPTPKSSPLPCNAYIVVPGTAFLAVNQVTFSEIQLQQFKQQKPHLSSFAGDFLSTVNTSSALVLYRRREFTLIVWSFSFLLPLVFPLRHCTEVRLTEGAVFFQVFVRYPLHLASLVPKYCLMLTFLSLRSKYYGGDVKVVATTAGKEMVYGKKNHSDSGEASPLNDIFRERHSPTTFQICSTSTAEFVPHIGGILRNIIMFVLLKSWQNGNFKNIVRNHAYSQQKQETTNPY